MQLGGPAKRKVNWWYIQFGFSEIYVRGSHLFPCVLNYCHLIHCGNGFKEYTFLPTAPIHLESLNGSTEPEVYGDIYVSHGK